MLTSKNTMVRTVSLSTADNLGDKFWYNNGTYYWHDLPGAMLQQSLNGEISIKIKQVSLAPVYDTIVVTLFDLTDRTQTILTDQTRKLFVLDRHKSYVLTIHTSTRSENTLRDTIDTLNFSADHIAYNPDEITINPDIK
jgi:hypothetical protein